MKNYLISAFALIAFISSCTPARQLAESPQSRVPAFKTWVAPTETSSAEAPSLETKEEIAEKTFHKEEPVPKQVKPENLEAAYARFRKTKLAANAENPASKELPNDPIPTQAIPTYDDDKTEVVTVYIDSNKPIRIKLIEGTPEGIQIIREVSIPKKSVEYEYPQLKKEATKQPEKVDPALLKSAPYVQKETSPSEDPQDLMMDLMEKKLEYAEEALSQTRDGQGLDENLNEFTSPKKETGIVNVYVSGNQHISIDENLLKQWEKKIVDARMGIDSSVKLPRWLLQGLEWVTHAPKSEPLRSETIMPLYRQLEARGHLDGINLNQMTPVQVVRRVRILVDELKASNGQLSMNKAIR